MNETQEKKIQATISQSILQWLNEHRGLSFILLVSAMLRFLFLDMKAPHFDEGVYGFFVQEIWRKGFFPYDPSNFHGPIYYYALQVSELVFGRGLFAFRFMSGVFSLATIYQIWRLNKYFGEVAIWAAIVVAFSPSAVFYSRYTMHESLFVLLQILFVHQIYELKHQMKVSTGIKLGIYAALCFATKETTIIFLFCIFFSIFLAELFDNPGKEKINLQWLVRQFATIFLKLDRRFLLVCVSAFFSLSLLTLFIYSGFGSEPARVVDFFRAYSFWTKTGTQSLSGHEKPFTYWCHLLVQYEWPALIGLMISPYLLFFGSKNSRLFSFFALGTLMAYSIIPYKTPWCILNIVWPLAFLFGFAIAELQSYQFFKNIVLKSSALSALEHARSNALSSILAIIVCLLSLVLSIQLNFFHFNDVREPYVYVQSSIDVNLVTQMIERRVRAFPEDLNMKILVALKVAWPFPWLFSSYTHVDYREIFAIPQDGHETPAFSDLKKLIENADVILVDQTDAVKIEQQINKTYFESTFRLRDSYNLCSLFLNADRFKINQEEFESEIAHNLNLGGDHLDMKFKKVEAMRISQ
jgi:uncharacterized protein (TIGR03663 family)